MKQNKEVLEKVIDLCIERQNENIKTYIEIIYNKIRICELQKQNLLNNKPYWFQKNKLNKYYDDIKNIDKKINKYYKEIEKEISIINENL